MRLPPGATQGGAGNPPSSDSAPDTATADDSPASVAPGDQILMEHLFGRLREAGFSAALTSANKIEVEMGGLNASQIQQLGSLVISADRCLRINFLGTAEIS